MITFKGYPDDGGLYTSYNVIRGEQLIGSIEVCGIFRKSIDVIALTDEERDIIKKMCKRVYEMPSEYGCLGVGESPTESFEDFLKRTNLKQDL